MSRVRLAARHAALRLRDSGPRGWVIAALGFAAAVALVVSEFLTVVYVKVLTASCQDLADPRVAGDCLKTGADEHSLAFALFAGVVLVMTYVAATRGGRGAALVLAAIGVVVLVIALASDLPDAHKVGAVGLDFNHATAHPGAGLWVEVAAGVLALAAAVVAFRLPEATRATPRSEAAAAA